MEKLLLFSGKNEKGIFTYVIDAERPFLEKTAAEYHPTIASYINNAKPIPGKTQVLLTALGAGEWWGNNVNGDYFPEESLAHEGEDYGYKTFMSHAKLYRHHINKPSSESYGEVVLAVYNPVFHRVELIVTFNHSNARDLVDRLNSGESLDFSMGCKVPYDVCSICGNKAPTRAQYCEHLKYYMGRVHPATGRVAYAINTRPKFFDISYVLIGADRIAKSLKKVASVSGDVPTMSSAYLAEKLAERMKAAEIKKEIPANEPPASQDSLDKATTLAKSIIDVKAMEPELPRPLLDDLAQSPLDKAMSTMVLMGILPKPREFQRIYLMGTGHRDLAEGLDRENLCFDPDCADNFPEASLPKLSIGAHNFDENIMRKLLPHMEDRSYMPGPLGRRIVIMIKRGEEQSIPTYVKVAAEDKERKPFGPAIPLAAAAGAYFALVKLAPKGTLQGIDKILSTNVGAGLAAALGLGLIRTFNTVVGPKLKGQYSPKDATPNPDANDAFAKIEEYKKKPFTKVGAGVNPGPAAKRLLGVPLAYMASGVLQKHKEISPDREEGRIRKFIRQNPDVISAALIADAVLSAKGHPLSSASMMGHINRMGRKTPFGKMASSIELANELCGYELLKTADAQDFLSNAVIWPLAMGKANLPGRIVGGLFDQAVLEAGSKILDKRQTNKKNKI